MITIGSKGIETPQTIPTTGNEVFGLKCAGSYIELLVREGESDHFSVLPFKVEDHQIVRGQREDIGYSLSQKGPTPPDIERKEEAFYDILDIRGDW